MKNIESMSDVDLFMSGLDDGQKLFLKSLAVDVFKSSAPTKDPDNFRLKCYKVAIESFLNTQKNTKTTKED